MSTLFVEHEGIKHPIDVTEKSTSWAKGVKISIYLPSGNLLNTVTYSCHPEFSQYDMYQSKDINELRSIAMSRFATDMATTDFWLATENGIGLLLPINNG